MPHESGLPDAVNRARGKQEQQSVVFYGRRPLIQGGELNDAQEIIRGRHDRLGKLVAKDGDRIQNALAVVDEEAGTVTLTAGTIYVAGDVLAVNERVLNEVPMSGRVEIGVRLVKTWITHEDDPELLGQVAGSDAEGEPGAARELAHLSWSRREADEPGAFYQVYVLQDGTLLEQNPPPLLDGMLQALAVYDRPHGNYIVSGCSVVALGTVGADRIFSIEEGEANINGFKIVRYAAIRFAQEEDWDVGAVPGETHTYVSGASHTFTTNEGPIDTVQSILLTRERTVNVTRGAVTNGVDALPDTSVVQIVSIAGYTLTTDYIRTGNQVDWAPAGAEPSPGTTYSVTYRYRDSVAPTAVNGNDVTVAGGATGGEIIIAYTFKLPRIDIIGLRQDGSPVYINGVSARNNPVAPVGPRDVLALAEVHNRWTGTPAIISNGVDTGVKAPTYSEIRRYFNFMEEQSRVLQLERLRSEVDRRDPAAKRGMFVDPFETDEFRDAGAAQNGAVGNRLLQLAIVPTFYDATLDFPVTLDWVEEVIINQPLKSICEKINPYANFNPLPGALALTPAADFWIEKATTFLSPVTLEFQRGIDWNAWAPRQTSSTQTQQVRQTEQAIPFLRQRTVAYEIKGFFPGEQLTALTFDGINIMPGGPAPVAGSDGRISGTFTIPANVVAGSKVVRAVGADGGTRASAVFTGQGTIVTDVMRRVTTIERWTPGRQFLTSNDDDSGSSDPQAQLFLVPETRQIVGVDFHLCVIGDQNNHILVHQVGVENGYPTAAVEAEAVVPMTSSVLGWKSARYSLPVTTGNDRDHAFVIKTDDNIHSISIAGLEGFDAALQQPITSHPYPVGPRFSSVNAKTWTAHQKEALAFRVIAARYPVTTKTVDLGSFALVQASDLQVRANVELPSAACSVQFEIVRANGTVYRVLPYQVLQLTEYLTETVQLRALLTGTNTLSPILYNPVELIAGRVNETAVYISRAFSIAGAARVLAFLRLALPGGSTATVEYNVTGNTWVALTLDTTEISPDPAWVERKYVRTGLSSQAMRLRITLNGGPAARPRAADLGLGAM